jgi:hypothetical protein
MKSQDFQNRKSENIAYVSFGSAPPDMRSRKHEERQCTCIEEWGYSPILNLDSRCPRGNTHPGTHYTELVL